MPNYLNRPSIFEIATAFENGNNGKIHPQNDDDSYKEVYNKLTEEEKSLSYKHPFLALKIKKNRGKAFRATSHFDGITNGYGDAIRHCYWCALNQVSAGLNSPLAEDFGNAHENTLTNTEKEKRMDLYNNSVGYYLGNQAIKNNWSEEELLNQVINAANNGKLKIGL